MTYTESYTCPQCGCGSKDLKPEALAVVLATFGNVVKLRCWVCGKEWLHCPTKEAL